MNKADEILRLENVTSGYGPIEIIHNVSLHVENGEIVALIGPNGSGKSTLLKTILGYLPVKSGRIIYNGKDITGAQPHELIRKGISYIPQGRQIFPMMNVKEHLELGTYIIKNKSKKEEAIKKVTDIFPILKERKNQRAKDLSGGERQMLSLARALSTDPKLLILDEISSGLAPKLLDMVFEKISEISSRGTAVLMVEQKAAQALKLCDRAYVLDGGIIRFSGKGRDLLKSEMVRKLYLGG